MGLLKIHITFDPAVTSAVAAFAPFKYNKQGAFCFQFDDGSHGILVADNAWDNYTYTDGCGNPKKYRGSVGMNHGIGVPGSADYDASVFNGAALLQLIGKGHDIENHSYYHTGNTDGLDGQPVFTVSDYDKALLSTILMDDTINRYTAYWPAGFIIPQNFTGFDAACIQLGGYLTCVSEGTDPFNKAGNTGSIIQGVIPANINDIPDFLRLTRFWVASDIWNTGNMAQYKADFDDVIAGSKNLMVLFTHSLLSGSGELSAFTDFFDYLRLQANDSILFASLREVTEYTQMRKVSLNQSLNNNVLTLTIDENDIPHRTRWRDCSFNINSDAPITSVAVEGFDGFSYNASTKLVNAFKQKTSWGTSVSARIPDPVQSKFITHGRFIAV